ncbi:MAG TPA: hypothetical protein VI279_06220 [Rhodocyclaceae bacterium]
MKLTGRTGCALLLAAYLAFALGAKGFAPPRLQAAEVPGSVVLPAPMQTALYLGDRYLAANVETTRVLTTGGPIAGIAQDYFDRLHMTVAALNPCHEDNYYVANSLMAWGGSVDPALDILRAATRCRFWDELPPFFLGFDLNFFKREHRLAKEALFEAAARSPESRTTFQRIGLMYEAEIYPDPRMAQAFLKAQRDQARDGRLRQGLDIRIGRLAGLVTLQDAQADYERRFAQPLQSPNDLLTRGVLKAFPTDPVGLGYVFEDGRFALREMKIRGIEGVRK